MGSKELRLQQSEAEPNGRSGRTRLAAVWHLIRWPLFGALVVLACALGFVGFWIYFDGQPSERSFTDIAYLTLQLFVLESGSVPETGAPWQFEIGRLLAPATTAIALMVALAAVFRSELEEVRLRFRRRHVVVCGLGERGTRLVRSLMAEGRQVVAVEQDPANPRIADLRSRGALVVVGDAREGDVLYRAGVGRAEYLVAVTGTDDFNAEMAIRAGEMAPDDGPALTCLAHIADPGLCGLLRSEELAAGRSGYRLDFFNIYEQGARALLHDHPAVGTDGEAPRLLLIGLNELGRALMIEAARQWRVHPLAAERRLHILAIDADAGRITDRLRKRYPQLDHVAEVRTLDSSLDHLNCPELAGDGDWSAAYVCVGDDPAALDIALRTRQCLENLSTPVVVELSRSAGLAQLLRRPGGYEGVHSFDLLTRTLQPELLLGGTYEVLARAIHAEYVEEQRRQGATSSTNPSLVPWEELPDSLRESNRDQAAHIGTKLATIGCGIAPLSDWNADRLTFGPEEIERLSELEHERWVEQRLRDGWTPGPKDVDAKTSPYLIPWSQLSDNVQAWDRRPVRTIPQFLAHAGYQVVRRTNRVRH